MWVSVSVRQKWWKRESYQSQLESSPCCSSMTGKSVNNRLGFGRDVVMLRHPVLVTLSI
jgi:hypothetical protein